MPRRAVMAVVTVWLGLAVLVRSAVAVAGVLAAAAAMLQRLGLLVTRPVRWWN
ncbi:MAG: hypothetical protein R3E95_08380 [Thiolinea sp.]